MGLGDYLGDDEDQRRRRRRLLLLLLLLLLVIVGAGIGGIVPGLGPSDDGPDLDIDDSPTPTPPGSGPTTTATRAAGGPGTTATGTPTGTPTGTGTPTDTDEPTGTVTPTVTGTPPTGTPPTGTPPTPTATPTVTPTDTPSPTPPPTTTTPAPTTTTPPPEDGLDLSFEGNDVILDYAGVAPGNSGSETVTLSNGGSVAGNLSIVAIEATDSENGIVGAEAEVDDTPNEGELSDHLRLAITATYPNGTSTALFGTGDGPRPVADLAAIESRSASGEIPPGEAATIRIDWVIPSSTDNVIQSDEVGMVMTFELRAPEDGS